MLLTTKMDSGSVLSVLSKENGRLKRWMRSSCLALSAQFHHDSGSL